MATALRTVYGTSPTLDAMVNLLAEFYHGTTVYLTERDDGGWSVWRKADGKPLTVQVHKVGKRYRFGVPA